jgi:hypothetical protein
MSRIVAAMSRTRLSEESVRESIHASRKEKGNVGMIENAKEQLSHDHVAMQETN